MVRIGVLATILSLFAGWSRAAWGDTSARSELLPELTLDGDGIVRQQPPQAEGAHEKPWRFDFAIYVWFSDLSGEMSIGVLSASMDESFSDLADKLSGALTLHFEAWKRNQLGFFADICWMQFEDTQAQSTALGTIEGDAEIEQAFIEGAVAARIPQEDVTVDFFTGVRVIYFKSELDLKGLGSRDKTRWFFDPMFGGRLIWDPLEWLRLSLRVDAAGFGIGTELTGNAMGLVGFRLSPMFAIFVGYRAMGVQVRDGAQDTNIRMLGPILAFDVGF